VLAAHALGQFLLDQGRLDEAAAVLRPAGEHADLLPEYRALLLGHAGAPRRSAGPAGRARAARRRRAAPRRAGRARLLPAACSSASVLLGDASRDTLVTLNSFGSFYRERGRPELARPLLEEAVPRAWRTRAARLEHAVRAQQPRAPRVRRGARRARRGIWTEILATDRADPQPDRHPVLAALSNLASLARDDGRLEQAERWAEQAVAGTPRASPSWPRARPSWPASARRWPSRSPPPPGPEKNLRGGPRRPPSRVA
jgi:tetratricopeptide (TPR) repeat protein